MLYYLSRTVYFLLNISTFIVTSTSASIPASGGTRSTRFATATIRAGAQKFANDEHEQLERTPVEELLETRILLNLVRPVPKNVVMTLQRLILLGDPFYAPAMYKVLTSLLKKMLAKRTIGRNITNTNPNLLRADINAVFEQYDGQFLNNRVVMEPGRNVHANALASTANISAQNLVNHVSENYTKTLRNYIKIRLKKVLELQTNFQRGPEGNIIRMDEASLERKRSFWLSDLFVTTSTLNIPYNWTLLDENRLSTRIQDCFRPDMALSIKQYKIFSLVSMYSFTRKYVEIDIKHLRNNDDNNEGDNEGDNENENDEENKHELTTLLFSQVFNFEYLRLDLYYNGKQMFINMVRTDGYGIDFILAGPKNQKSNLPDLDFNDFTPRKLNENFCLWGADPGQTNIFTASDGHGNDSHQVRKYSTAEYYTRADFKKLNKTILNLKNGDEQLLEAERNITTFKTANMEVFILYIHSVLNNIDVQVRFYVDRFTSLRFLNYIDRQRADVEMVNIFATVALGDAVFPSSMKGTIPGLARRLEKKLKISEREGLLVTVPVTEYMTSKTCSNCSRNDTENIEIDGIILFSVCYSAQIRHVIHYGKET
ncbi:hypothetical protein EDC94DRAFT_651986 [Helicostylum pulchrum]|nr:hypothetical protein EDC94DRAFT_651986 [Helicostylum pulchrum]